MTRLIALIIFLVAAMVQSALAADAVGGIPQGQILRGRFVQERHLAGFAAPLKSEGRFLLAPGRGLIWSVEKPFAVTTVISPGGLIQEMQGNETMRLPAARLPALAKLYGMLGGALTDDWRGLETVFDVVRDGGPDAWRMILTPKRSDDPAMPFRAIALRGGRFVDEVELRKPDQDRDRLLFLDQALSAGAPTGPELKLLDALGAP